MYYKNLRFQIVLSVSLDILDIIDVAFVSFLSSSSNLLHTRFLSLSFSEANKLLLKIRCLIQP